MSKKLYTAIGAELRPLVLSADSPIERQTLQSVVIRLANVFRSTSAAFSRERFYVACGFDADGR